MWLDCPFLWESLVVAWPFSKNPIFAFWQYDRIDQSEATVLARLTREKETQAIHLCIYRKHSRSTIHSVLTVSHVDILVTPVASAGNTVVRSGFEGWLVVRWIRLLHFLSVVVPLCFSSIAGVQSISRIINGSCETNTVHRLNAYNRGMNRSLADWRDIYSN